MEKSILLKDEVPCCFILKLANYVFFGIKHFLIPFIFIVSTITFLQAQSVITDKLDYNPAEIANITAKGYHIGETVQFLILHTDGTPNTGGGHLPWTVVDGGVNDIDGLANGIIETSWYVNPDDSFNSVFELTAQGLTSNIFSKHVFIDDTPIPTNIVTNYNNGTLTLNVDWSWVELNGAEKVLGVAVFADTDGDGDLPGLESSYPGGFLPEEFLGQTVEGSVEGCTNGDCTTGGIGAGNVGDNVPHTLFPNGLTPPEVGVTSGSFIITFTGLSNAPKSICVITYDIHVTSKDNPPGVYTIKGNNHSPITSGDDRNKDNSVEEGHSDITVSCDDLCNPDDVTCKIQDISTNCSVPNPLIDPAEVFDNSILCSGSMISIDSKVITNICVNDSFTRTYTLFFDDDGNGILDSGEEIIKECPQLITITPAVISCSVQGVNPSCNGNQNGYLTASASGGCGDLDYSLDGVTYQEDGVFSGLSSGVYIVTVKDENDCTSTCEVTISNPAALSCSIEGTDPSCGGSDGSLIATGVGGTGDLDYSLDGVTYQEDGVFSGLLSGVYAVTVKDENDCTSICEVILSNPATLSCNIVQDSAVSTNGGSDGEATVTPVGGTPPYTYLWDNGETTVQATGLNAGLHSVTVTDSQNCETSCEIIIEEPVDLNCSTSEDSPVICNGESNGMATVTPVGGTSPYTYLWDNGETTVQATGLNAGTHSVIVTDASQGETICEVVIDEPDALEASAEGATISCSCYGSSDGSIDLTVIGGTQDYTYLWSPDGETTEDLSGLSAGTYSVLVTDANGCTTTEEVVIGEPGMLSCDITETSPVSTNGGSDGEATVSVEGGTPNYTYLWSPGGATTAVVTELSAGNYMVTVIDSSGCETTCDITITEPDPIVLSCSVTQNNGVTCYEVNDGSAKVIAEGGVPPYKYLWDNGENTQIALSLAAGFHTVKVTDATDVFTECEISISTPSELEASAEAEGATTYCSCYGASDGSIDLTVTGGTPEYTYLWSPGGETTEDLSGLSAGTYSVLVTDANGCTTTEEVVIGEPGMLNCNVIKESPASSHDTADGVATVIPEGGTPPYAYLWDNGETTEQATSLNTGEHSVTVTDSQNCETTCDIIIECLPDELNCSVVEDSPVICNGESNGVATVTPEGGLPPYTYLWDNGETTAQATGLNAGMHSVTVTDAYQTESTCEVMIEEPDTLEASVEGAITNCSCYGSTDGEINLTVSGGTPPYMYLWSNGATSEDLSDLSAGTYSVIVTDTNGCITDEEVTIGEPGALICNIIQDSPVSTYGGDDGEATVSPDGGVPPYTYLWDNGETTAQATNLTAGAHSIIVTDALYCETTCGITIEESGSSVCNIYPVPFVDTVNIEYLLGNLSEALIEVYDMKGRLIKTKSDKNIYFRKVTKFNLGHKVFSNQVYFVKVTSGGKSTMKRVVSKR